MISSSKFYLILNSLSRKGFVKTHSVNLGGRGGLTNFLEITPEGCEAIGVKPKPHLTRGGDYVTDVWVYKISSQLKEIMPGWRISIEKELQGKFVDIVVSGVDQAFVIAIEVELSEANLESNVTKDVERVDFLIEACLNETLVEKVKEIIGRLPGSLQEKAGVCRLPKLLHCEKLSQVVDSRTLRERGL